MLNKERQTRNSVQTMLPVMGMPQQPIIPAQNPLMMALGGQTLDPQRLLQLANSLPQGTSFQQPLQAQQYPNYSQPYPPPVQQYPPVYNYSTNPVPVPTPAPVQNIGNILSQLSNVQNLLKRTGQGR
jgi:hypothetical protein